MTVGELIEELKKYPKEKMVEVGSQYTTFGPAERVTEYPDSIDIEFDEF